MAILLGQNPPVYDAHPDKYTIFFDEDYGYAKMNPDKCRLNIKVHEIHREISPPVGQAAGHGSGYIPSTYESNK